MLQEANAYLFNPLVTKSTNSLQFPLQIKPSKS